MNGNTSVGIQFDDFSWFGLIVFGNEVYCQKVTGKLLRDSPGDGDALLFLSSFFSFLFFSFCFAFFFFDEERDAEDVELVGDLLRFFFLTFERDRFRLFRGVRERDLERALRSWSWMFLREAARSCIR